MTTRSYSDLNSYGRCAFQFYLRDTVRIQRKKRNPNLYQGSSAHGGLEAFFIARRNGESFGKAMFAMHDYFQETRDTLAERNPLKFDDELDEIRELIEEAQELVGRYLTKHKDEIETWEILHVEEEFTVTLQDEQVITFTPDLIIRDRNGFVWIIDHKTTSKMPGIDLPFSDLQTLMYFAGVQSMYPDLRGFIFNYIRKKAPTEPRLNKTHNKESKLYGHYFINNLKSLDTTFEILRDFLTNEAPELLGEPAHMQKLADLRDVDRFFWQEALTVTPEQVQEALLSVEETLAQMNWSEETGLFPRTILNDLAGVQACSNCEFSRICHTSLLGWNTDMVIEEEYEPRDPKNEYESEDE